MNFYNEFDPNAAAWLRELIAQGLIPDGVVDERSITEITPHDLSGYTQCHFFAGVGGWPLGLRLAGWPADRPVGSGSCPCQPYSAAGKSLGDKDPRNLWPAFRDLIFACRKLGQPWAFTVFGEQVASAIGHGWLDGVSTDLEREGYACGAVVLGAHSVGSPHQRQRLYWVADSVGDAFGEGLQGHGGDGGDGDQPGRIGSHPVGSTATTGAVGGGLGDPASGGLGEFGDAARTGGGGHADGAGSASNEHCALEHSESVGHAHGELAGRGERMEKGPCGRRVEADAGLSLDASWRGSYWHYCRDGKHRRVPTEPALFPLADGLPYKLARRGSVRPALLKGAGNAIVPQVAAGFIRAYLDARA